MAETLAFIAEKKELSHDANPKDETARLLAIAEKISVLPEIRDLHWFITSFKDWYKAYDETTSDMEEFKRKNTSLLPCKMPSEIRQSQLKGARSQNTALKGMWEGVAEVGDDDFEATFDMAEELDGMCEEKTAYVELLVSDHNGFWVRRALVLTSHAGESEGGDDDPARLMPKVLGT